MIIMILIIAVFVILAIITVLMYLNGADLDDVPLAPTAAAFGISAVALFVGAVACAIYNFPSNVATCEYTLAEKIKFYENEKRMIESYHPVTDGTQTTFTSDITFEVISTADYYGLIRDYNKTIFDFKTEVVREQNTLNNPWISWFANPGYASVTADVLESLEYTVGR